MAKNKGKREEELVEEVVAEEVPVVSEPEKESTPVEPKPPTASPAILPVKELAKLLVDALNMADYSNTVSAGIKRAALVKALLASIAEDAGKDDTCSTTVKRNLLNLFDFHAVRNVAYCNAKIADACEFLEGNTGSAVLNENDKKIIAAMKGIKGVNNSINLKGNVIVLKGIITKLRAI